MKALWNSLEQLDRALFKGAQRVEQLRKQSSFRARMEQSVEEVRPPQKAIRFDA
ncbi:MAG TPA: hypothetical protein VN764_18350 [Polyangiaceae bacterium]|nr:hypothetical protein [Polyangiaceae bacterium]